MLDQPSMRAALAAQYDLTPSLDAAEATRPVWEKAARVIPFAEWAQYAPYVLAINRLKRERDAVILGHNYMTPQVFHGVCDVVGDSLQLAMAARDVSASVIVQGGVHFMAETSKVLNPTKTVLMPDMAAGCSLASSITAEGVAEMRRRHPGAPVVAYVNTSAEVKAAADICCTSANAAAIVRKLDAGTVIMLPDKYLAQNVARQVPDKTVVWWDGACIVHEQFTAADLRAFRAFHPGTRIIAHPECPPDVVAEADFTGSTAGIIDYVGNEKPPSALLVTECSMASNISDAHPAVEFVGPCTMCPYMKMITLEKILWSLHSMTTEVEVAPHLAEGARRSVQRMIDLSAR
jgi:quinolinate synthase